MSYDNASTTAILSRTAGLGHIIMFWAKVVTYPGTTLWTLLYGEATFNELVIGADGTNITTTQVGFTTDGPPDTQIVATGSNTAWLFFCVVADDTVGINYQCYWRAEGETALHFGTLGTASAGGFTQLFLMNNPPTSHNVHCRITAYKEWTAYNALSPGQIFAESTQNAPIVTTGLANYLQCDAGHTIGVDQSAAANNWTVSGTITTNADEPSMGITKAYVRQAFIHEDTPGPGTLGTTLTCQLTNILAGSTLVMYTTCDNGSQTTRTITSADDVNGSWGSPLNTIHDTFDNFDAYQSYFPNTASGTINVTCTFSTSTQYKTIGVMECVNVTTAPLDGHNGLASTSGTGGSDGWDAGTVTNTSQPALVIGFSAQMDTAFPPNAGTGFTDFGVLVGAFAAQNAARWESKRITATNGVGATFTDTQIRWHLTLSLKLNEAGVFYDIDAGTDAQAVTDTGTRAAEFGRFLGTQIRMF